MKIKLNCDLGESFGAWSMGVDSKVMPYIDQANIACGFHAGDPLVIQKTLTLAKEHNVSVGAHPSYPDLVGFGRRSMVCSTAEISAMIHYQVAAIEGMAAIQGVRLDYVKPHGALYNDMMVKPDVFDAIICALSQYPTKLALMMQATPDFQVYKEKADKLGVTLYREAFADRCYDDSGRLLNRSQAGAVLETNEMLEQVKLIAQRGCVTTLGGNVIPLAVDSICVHGDNSKAVEAIAMIREILR